MFQTNENPAADRAFASNLENGLNTADTSKIHPSTQIKTTPISDHKRAENMFGFALMFHDTDTWLGMIPVLKARLTPHERVALLFVSLSALKPEDAAMTVEAVFGQRGTPLPPLISAMDDASFWADFTDLKYIKACVLAGYNRMPLSDQIAFLDYVQGRKGA